MILPDVVHKNVPLVQLTCGRGHFNTGETDSLLELAPSGCLRICK